MDSMEILRDEHKSMHEMLSSLEKAIGSLQSGHRPDEHAFRKAFEFIDSFVCQRHLPKELLLFRILGEKGYDTPAHVLERLIAEHDQVSGFVDAGRQAYEEALKGRPFASRLLAENMLAYIGIMKVHLASENGMFDSIGKKISLEDRHVLDAAFSRLEKSRASG